MVVNTNNYNANAVEAQLLELQRQLTTKCSLRQVNYRVRQIPSNRRSNNYITDPPRIGDQSVIESSLLSTARGRQHRLQRDINKLDLHHARRYGMEEAGHRHRLKYTYGGIVFIYDPILNSEVTSFPSRDHASDTSGTKCTQPVFLSMKEEYLNASVKDCYKEDRLAILAARAQWTSHTVLVVDMSGSMRTDDVNGARCRSDGVWIVLARDFIKIQLERKSATIYDLVSVVLMNDAAQSVLICFPMHWYLYNKFLSFREWKAHRPQGPGNYLPALDEAERLLNINPSGSCSLSLMFFSDGKPSDQGPFQHRMGRIASKFGRRLTVCCIGMADDLEDFSTLEQMAIEARNYGAMASFNKPSLNTDSLSNIVSSLVTSLATSKIEMTDSRSGKLKSVRMDIRRERKGAQDDFHLGSDWRVLHDTDSANYVSRVWTWSYKLDDFVALVDPRCIECFRSVADENFDVPLKGGLRCSECKACFICHFCIDRESRNYQMLNHVGSDFCKGIVSDRRRGKIIKWAIPSFCLAVKDLVFDEGAERIVYKVRFLDRGKNFIGPKMVAKESRFVLSDEDRMHYHRDFLRTQDIASEFADKFNEALDALKDHFDEFCHVTIDNYPRIRFLKPFVVEARKDGTEWNILVEEQLEGTYTKFNNNKGYVHRSAREVLPELVPLDSLDTESDELGANGLLDVIAEESEEKDDDDDSDEEVFDQKNLKPDRNTFSFEIRPEHIPQAFSHFTFEKSKKQLMVVDLQGVLQANVNGKAEYVLTDPAIHKRKRKQRRNKLHSWTFGRTDRGESGMRHFFATHHCNDMCRILGLPEKQKYYSKEYHN